MLKILCWLVLLFSCSHRPSTSREVLILLHGHADYAGSWKPWQKYLSQFYHVHALDLPGYNHVDAKLFDQAKLEDLLLEINSRIQKHTSSAVTIMGHDVGAYLAFRLAERYPTLVKQVVSFNLPHPKDYFAWYEKNPPNYIENYLKKFQLSPSEQRELYQWKSQQDDYADYLKAMHQSSSQAMLNYYQQIFSPAERKYSWQRPIKCLVLAGAKDPAVPLVAFEDSVCAKITLNSGEHDLHLSQDHLLHTTVLSWIQHKLHFKHVHFIDDQLKKSYIAKFDQQKNIYAIGDPLVSFSAPYYTDKKVIADQLQAIDFLTTKNNDEVLLASDFTAPRDNRGIGRLLKITKGKKQELTRIPNLHRMVWLDAEKTQFVAASIFSTAESSPQFNSTPAQIVHFVFKNQQWVGREIKSSLKLLHGIKAGESSNVFYTASWEGVHRFEYSNYVWKSQLIYAGDLQNGFSGSSEVVAGNDFIATLGPWHGDHLTFLRNGMVEKKLQHLNSGHGLALLDFDLDGVSDVVGCFMGSSSGVYWFNAKDDNWAESVILPRFKCEGITSDGQSLLITGESKLLKIDF